MYPTRWSGQFQSADKEERGMGLRAGEAVSGNGQRGDTRRSCALRRSRTVKRGAKNEPFEPKEACPSWALEQGTRHGTMARRPGRLAKDESACFIASPERG